MISKWSLAWLDFTQTPKKSHYPFIIFLNLFILFGSIFQSIDEVGKGHECGPACIKEFRHGREKTHQVNKPRNYRKICGCKINTHI